MNSFKKDIIKYIKTKNGMNTSSIDIYSHFELIDVNETYTALRELENSGKIIRKNFVAGGFNENHSYELVGE